MVTEGTRTEAVQAAVKQAQTVWLEAIDTLEEAETRLSKLLEVETALWAEDAAVKAAMGQKEG